MTFAMRIRSRAFKLFSLTYPRHLIVMSHPLGRKTSHDSRTLLRWLEVLHQINLYTRKLKEEHASAYSRNMELCISLNFRNEIVIPFIKDYSSCSSIT